jgi:hypothetical protein
MQPDREHWAQIIAKLDAVNRIRPLTEQETAHLATFKGQRWWTKGEIGRLKRYLQRGKKPAQIAPLLGRTERSVWRMIYRQGWGVRPVCNGASSSRVRRD